MKSIPPIKEVIVERELLQKLRKQSTWMLFFLGFITYGVYLAHYTKRQTKIMNEFGSPINKISMGFVNAFMACSYISLIFFFAYMFVEEGHPIETVSSVIDFIWIVWMLIWALMARNLMNGILKFEHGTKQRFNGLWTFLFLTYYFNYKVNQLNEAIMYDTHSTSFRYDNDKAVIYQCPQCGRDVAEGLRFCPRCGQLLVGSSS